MQAHAIDAGEMVLDFAGRRARKNFRFVHGVHDRYNSDNGTPGLIPRLSPGWRPRAYSSAAPAWALPVWNTSMTDYQLTRQFLKVLSDLDDLFEQYNRLTRRRQDWFTRNLPLPDEKGDREGEEIAREVMSLAGEIEETRWGALRYVAAQGQDSLRVQTWLQILLLDLREVHAGIPCENRTRRQSTDVQTIVSHALVLGMPQEHGNEQAIPKAPEPEASLNAGNDPIPLRPIWEQPFATVKQLADALGQRESVIRSCLDRHRKRHLDCREPVPRRRKHEERYLYRVPDVWPMLCEHYGTPGQEDS
jgi:hypothetical protein